MPWWFWPLAVAWSLPIVFLVVVFVWFTWLSVESRRHRRWLERQADERLSVPRPHADLQCFSLTDEHRDRLPNPIGAQRSNPRGVPRADQWRI